MKKKEFIRVGAPVVPKGTKIVAYITEILGDTIITTDGSYKEEDLEDVITVSVREQWTQDVINKYFK